MKKLVQRFFSTPVPATVKLNGEWVDVDVECGYQPEERDVNIGQGVDIYTVQLTGQGDIADDIAPADMRELKASILEQFNQICADYLDGYAEYRAEMRRERLYE